MLTRTLNGIAMLAGAALLAQFPAFYGHYLQRLGGRLDQAEVQAGRIEAAARAEGMSLERYIAEFLDSARSAHRRQGRIMREEIAERGRLRAARAALAAARPLERPLRFARHFDPGLARATLDGFGPGLPLSAEGFVYAGLGALGGLGLAAGGRRARARLARSRGAA